MFTGSTSYRKNNRAVTNLLPKQLYTTSFIVAAKKTNNLPETWTMNNWTNHSQQIVILCNSGDSLLNYMNYICCPESVLCSCVRKSRLPLLHRFFCFPGNPWCFGRIFIFRLVCFKILFHPDLKGRIDGIHGSR